MTSEIRVDAVTVYGSQRRHEDFGAEVLPKSPNDGHHVATAHGGRGPGCLQVLAESPYISDYPDAFEV
ncbi:hypothetical protein ACFVMC_00170 [Nocardia sp. NPDC127579]|uniref:hypothetical protein n=1 Tax=Nocardia sp. NPDC127579 TaxID=3345402 RepID=UPI0036402DAB